MQSALFARFFQRLLYIFGHLREHLCATLVKVGRAQAVVRCVRAHMVFILHGQNCLRIDVGYQTHDNLELEGVSFIFLKPFLIALKIGAVTLIEFCILLARAFGR